MWTQRLSELGIVLALSLVVAAARGEPPPQPARPTADDPLAPYRERFRQGMERYKEASLADAIGYWEPIYRELGEEKGYRLAYNLGIAYAELGDATRAAERFESFLTQVAARTARGEAIEDIVTKEETESRARLATLTETRGRIRVEAGPRPCAAQVDASDPRLAGYVAWVSPGRHTVTFSPATRDAASQTVNVGAGEIVTLSPPVPPPVLPAVSAPEATAPPVPAPPPPEPPRVVGHVTSHPFSPMVLAVSGGLSFAAGIAAIPLDANAWALRSSDLAEKQQTSNIPQSDRQSFSQARTEAYAAIGAGIGLAAVTASLAAWYFIGAQRREVVATPSGIAWKF